MITILMKAISMSSEIDTLFSLHKGIFLSSLKHERTCGGAAAHALNLHSKSSPELLHFTFAVIYNLHTSAVFPFQLRAVPSSVQAHLRHL